MKNVEYLIVGNGLAGTMLAFEMYAQKLDFRIISSSQIKRATEAAAGMYNPLVFKRLTKSWLADELLPVMKEKYRAIETILSRNFLHEKDILKPLSEQEKLLWLERKNDPSFSEYISDIKDQTPGENLVPAAGFGQVTQAGYLDLSVFLKATDEFFRKKGFLFEGEVNAENMSSTSNFILPDNSKASKIIFCEGANLRNNSLFNFIKLVPVKGEVLLLHSHDISEKYILNKKVFLLPVGNQKFKAGSTYDWKDLTNSPTEQGRASILERLNNLISANYSVEYHWAGVRPAVSDRRPVLGVHPKYKQFSVFNGLGTKGVMLAPYFASEMLNLLTISNYTINAEVDTQRFYN